MTINLEDLFEGNIESCLDELSYSKECGKKWREIYDKNIAIMPKDKKWDFEPDSIFAQIEAFV